MTLLLLIAPVLAFLGGGSLTNIVLAFIFGAIYFLPTIVAFQNKRTNITAIFILNLLLGWSFIGWVVALIWAVKKD